MEVKTNDSQEMPAELMDEDRTIQTSPIGEITKDILFKIELIFDVDVLDMNPITRLSRGNTSRNEARTELRWSREERDRFEHWLDEYNERKKVSPTKKPVLEASFQHDKKIMDIEGLRATYGNLTEALLKI